MAETWKPIASAPTATAQDAIDFALDFIVGEAGSPPDAFLFAWRDGDLREWPEFYEWLDERRIAALSVTEGEK